MKTFMWALFVMGTAANIAVAADNPDFSGTWKLDPDKSAFGPMPPPTSLTLVIDHKEPAVSASQSSTGPQGDQNTTSNYSTDGTETVNNFMGTEVRSKAHWEDKTLVIESILDPGGSAVKLTSKWSLSDDGSTLTDALKISSPQGDLEMAYVLMKQ
jgi:hypothetical protein